MHKLEVRVLYLSPNKLYGLGLTCGTWKAEVVHIYDFYSSSGLAAPVGGCLKLTGNAFGLFCFADYDLYSSRADRSVEP